MELFADRSNLSFTGSAGGADNHPITHQTKVAISHVRKRNRQDSDRRLRRRRDDRFARDLLHDPDGRVAVCGVRAGGGVLRHVPSGILLVEGVRAGPRPVGAKCADLVELVEGEREVFGVEGFLDAVVLGAKTVMTRVELGGTLFVAAVIGVLLTSREG